jgi:hypothetical protein
MCESDVKSHVEGKKRFLYLRHTHFITFRVLLDGVGVKTGWSALVLIGFIKQQQANMQISNELGIMIDHLM